MVTKEAKYASVGPRYCKKCGAELPSTSDDKYCLYHQKEHKAEKQAALGIGMTGLALAIRQGAKKYGPQVAETVFSYLSKLKK